MIREVGWGSQWHSRTARWSIGTLHLDTEQVQEPMGRRRLLPVVRSSVLRTPLLALAVLHRCQELSPPVGRGSE